MKQKLQLIILSFLIITAIIIMVSHWIQQSNQQNEIDEVFNLFNKVRQEINPATKISFTSNETKDQKIILYDYALLAAAPIAIADDNSKNDTILALDQIQNSSAGMYKNYQVIAKKFGDSYILHLLVKK